jgi:hypothetical protein
MRGDPVPGTARNVSDELSIKMLWLILFYTVLGDACRSRSEGQAGEDIENIFEYEPFTK